MESNGMYWSATAAKQTTLKLSGLIYHHLLSLAHLQMNQSSAGLSWVWLDDFASLCGSVSPLGELCSTSFILLRPAG